jgi:hypothetical protein
VQAELREAGDDGAAALTYVRRLNRRAATFAKIIEPSGESDAKLRTRLSSLAACGGRTARPLALWLFEQKHLGLCDQAELTRCLLHIESFIVRRYLCAMPPNNLNSMFGVMLSKLNKDGTESAETRTVEDLLLDALLASPKEWPDNDAVRHGVLTQDFYNSGDTQQRIHALSSLDLSFGYDLKPNYEESDESIEHIVPQSRPQWWESDLKSCGEDLVLVQERWLHTLPNLTLVSPSDNSKLGNKRFSEKRAVYDQVGYKMTRLVSKFADNSTGEMLWASKSMQARGDELADKTIKVWPRKKAKSAAADVVFAEEFDSVEIEADIGAPVPFTSSVSESESE